MKLILEDWFTVIMLLIVVSWCVEDVIKAWRRR